MTVHTELADRLSFIDFDQTQRHRLTGVQGELETLLSNALDRFYGNVARTPTTNAFFRDRAHMQAAKSAQQAHWRKITTGRFDEEYYSSVQRIGHTHARIGLEPRWYVGAYALVLENLVRGMVEGGQRSRIPGRGKSFDPEAVIAVIKAAMLDLELSVSIYFDVERAGREEAMATVRAKENELTALLSSVSQTADRVLTGTSQIAEASEDLARRTESNAASLEETSAAVTQMDNRIKATAQAANMTVARADQAMGVVGSGREVADDAVQAMGRVAESAKGIDTVIEGLDKIAFQTRVLAMNAAVEAGRAGEAGRGFAVVADLVSALAMRAEEEAKRARDQLTVTQTEVQSAVGAVQKVDGALVNISEDVGEVHKLLGSMAADNAAQSEAISEITAAIGSMDRSTQQNAAMVEQTSAAARSLMTDVRLLAESAGRMNKGSAPAPAPAAARVAAPAPTPAPVATLPGHVVVAGNDEWNAF